MPLKVLTDINSKRRFNSFRTQILMCFKDIFFTIALANETIYRLHSISAHFLMM